jgi:hypothetical protein
VANGFSKEEIVYFDKLLEAYDDALVLSRAAVVTQTDQQTMERTSDTVWFPMPYIVTSYSGNDATSNFKDVTQLSVPAQINQQRHVPFSLTARQLRDAQQEGRLREAATVKLASDINVDVMNLAAVYGSVVVKRTAAASGYADVAAADTMFTTQGIPREGRVLMLSPGDYNGMSGDLAARQTLQGKTLAAYEESDLGMVSGFRTYKADYAYRLTAAAGVTVTITNTQPLSYVPVSTSASSDGLTQNNVDNRKQVISIAVTSGAVKVGDAFQIAGVNGVHHIAKQDTGQPKTFRIVGINTGAGGTGTVTITPPIIANDGVNPSTAQYQNVTAAPANGAAITFLNTTAAAVNPFWQGDAVQILPGRLEPKPDSGLAVMSAETSQGFQLTMTRQGSIFDLSTKYRIDAIWGSFAANPEMMGVELFGQA